MLLFALVGLIVGIGIFLRFPLVPDTNPRSALSADALAQAKTALIGYALTYRDTHPDESFGYLPCPDEDNDGQAEPSCGSSDVSVVGRLPWKTLGLPPLRDADNECLWYAVSGSTKNNPKTASYNWDTLGQFVIKDKLGNIQAGATPHAQPLAVVFSPGSALAGQERSGGTECTDGGAARYLEGIAAVLVAAPAKALVELGSGDIDVVLATADSVKNGTNNDRAVWIGSQEIFAPIKKRADFKSDLDGMLNDVATYLNTLTPAMLPAATGSKGIDTLATNYLATALPLRKTNLFSNWKDNLLYTKPGTASTVNGEAGCHAVLLFGGERTESGQSRATDGERASSGNYLEVPLAALFPAAGAYTGSTDYLAASTTTDLVHCIKGLTPPAMQAAFATDFPSFMPAGTALAVTTDPDSQTVGFQAAGGSIGGCLWYKNAAPLAGRTLRAYYTYQFGFADPAGGVDRGYGFTLQLTRGDLDQPSDCGREIDNGALAPTSATGTWGSLSFIVETDVHRDGSRNDPGANHTAIMKNGSVDHAGYGVLASTACNGTRNLCEHSPGNKFEESPAPPVHNQRLEVLTGCNAGCTACDPTPTGHASPNTYAKVSVWADCTNCSNVAINLDRNAQTPTVQVCSNLDASMNNVFFGLTAGVSSGQPNGVTIRDFVLRSE